MTQPLIETTILDYIEVNGRISKKLFKKIICPIIEDLYVDKDNLLKEIEKKDKRIRQLEEYLRDIDIDLQTVSINLRETLRR